MVSLKPTKPTYCGFVTRYRWVWRLLKIFDQLILTKFFRAKYDQDTDSNASRGSYD